MRQQLADDNKPLKYMRYAVGEIVLVVIGILIALQINNWNEDRKDILRESKILKELVKNIEYNNQNIESYIQDSARYNAYSDYVIAVLEGAIPYSDSLDHKLNFALINRDDFSFSKVAYEALKNTGIELIHNDALKNEIVKLFDEKYPTMMNRFTWTSTNFQKDYIDHHFFPVLGNNNLVWKPYDFNVQMKDPYFRSIIQKMKIQRNFYATRMNKTLEESKYVLQLIKDELKK